MSIIDEFINKSVYYFHRINNKDLTQNQRNYARFKCADFQAKALFALNHIEPKATTLSYAKEALKDARNYEKEFKAGKFSKSNERMKHV